MPKFDVCALGGVCWDFVGIVDCYPELDEKTVMSEVVQMGGGLSGTAMAAVAALGGKACIFGRIGDDDFGQKILDGFHQERVDTSGLQVLAGITSQFAFCVAHRETGRRSIFWKPGTYERMGPGDVDLEALTDCQCLLVDHHHLAAATEAARYARARGIPVVADVERVQPGAVELIAAVDVPILPRGFVRALAGEDDLDRAARHILSLGPKTVVVTCGDEGVLAYTEGERLHQPACCVAPVVDTTGAGDVFHGAFAYGLALGYDLPQNLRFAGAAASLSCRGLGGRGALATMGQVQEVINA